MKKLDEAREEARRARLDAEQYWTKKFKTEGFNEQEIEGILDRLEAVTVLEGLGLSHEVGTALARASAEEMARVRNGRVKSGGVN